MRLLAIFALSVAIGLSFGGTRASAQQPSCLAANAISNRFAGAVHSYLEESDPASSALRDSLQLTLPLASNLAQVVTADSVCLRVAEAMELRMRAANPSSPQRDWTQLQLHVYRIGSTGYAAFAPADKVGEYYAGYVLGSDFRVITVLAF